MNRVISAVLTASALIFGVFLSRGLAVDQTVKELVGMWTLVSVTLEQDGTRSICMAPIHKAKRFSPLTAAFP